MATKKSSRREKIHKGIRNKISGTAERPRISVFKSNKAIYAQAINDLNGETLVAASSLEVDNKMKINIEVSKEVGKKLAEKAIANGVKEVIFDRSGYIYHGKIKALADGAREGGLKF